MLRIAGANEHGSPRAWMPAHCAELAFGTDAILVVAKMCGFEFHVTSKGYRMAALISSVTVMAIS